MIVDYKELYLKAMFEIEKAIQTLIAVQQYCEERYLEGEDPPELILLSGDTKGEEGP